MSIHQALDRALITEIYVVGPSSTGKTTLCRALAERLGLEGPEFITEVAREVMQQERYSRDDIGKLEMQAAIMRAQLLREQTGRTAAATTGRVLLSDRSAIDPIVYAILTSASEEEAEERVQSLTESHQFQLALAAYRKSLFVLLGPVPEWLEDDGVRSTENQVSLVDSFDRIGCHLSSCTQIYCHEVFKGVLAKLKISWTRNEKFSDEGDGKDEARMP